MPLRILPRIGTELIALVTDVHVSPEAHDVRLTPAGREGIEPASEPVRQTGSDGSDGRPDS